jgi:serine protease Do
MTMKRRLSPLNAALLGAGAIATTAAVAIGIDDQAPVRTDVQVAAAPPGSTPIERRTNAPDYSAIVQKYGPAVVGVTVQGRRDVSDDGPRQQQQIPEELRRFFRGIPGFPGFGVPMPPGGELPFRGSGSGFIVSADGLILTNAHVVQDAKEVTVKLHDRREFSAKVLGSDPMTDVAVLRIDAKDLPTVQIGDPDALRVGDPVLAIGAPFGFEQSATQGIVSAKGRSLPGDAVVPFIQTDAAVNPGNSGGPLFDDAGNVVGINSQIYSRTGGYQGLAFAIPIDVALKVKDQIVATGKAQHARLGVTVQDVTQPLADSFGLKRPDGALVSNVAPESAAAQAGLKSGDVIVAVNGEPVVRSGELSSRIGMAQPGDKVTLTVVRDKEKREIQATLGRMDGEATRNAAAGAEEHGKLGLAVRPLTADEKRESRIEQGLVVQQASGAAARAGISEGDVLLSINGKPVGSIDDIRAVLDKKPSSVALLVERDGNRLFVPVPLG